MFLINFLFVTLKILFLIQESYQYCFEVSPPENGKIHMSVDYSYYQVACDPGYTIKGDQVVLCEEDKWNKPIPTCVKAVCETLTDPINGRVECDEGPLYPGKKCTFSCFEGYKLRGVSTKRCLPTFVWSGPHTLCLPNSGVFCDVPPPLENGKIIGCSPTQSIEEYHKCYFRCNGGYTLNGPSEMTCIYNGKLTDDKGKEDLPVCSRGAEKVPYVPMVTRDNSAIPKRTQLSSSQSLTQTDSNNFCSNLQCQQLCKIIDGQAQCKCEKGYKLNLDKITCRVNKPCNINNGGCHQTQLCIEKENKTVECRRKDRQLPGKIYTTQYERRYPETASGPETPTTQTCEDGNGGCEHECYRTSLREVKCYCKPGYQLHSDGKHCIGKDRQLPDSIYTTHYERRYPETASGPRTTQTCEDGNGGCEHECYRTSSTEVNCFCLPGYQLHSDGKHCIDVDECLDENLNKCQHECHNNEGSYTCSCRLGYVLYDSHKCKGCRKNSYWSDELKGCVDCPRNSHTKSEGKITIEDCICNPGFTGNPGAHVTCDDIDECHENKYGCSGTCVNILGGAYCICPSGFTLDSDNKTCIDIDECRIKNGGCEGLCINRNGSFICICLDGYKTSDKDPYLCDDVDECSQNNGGCEQNCVNYRGGFHCACDPGYRFDMDLKSCNEIQCPRLPLPNYSTMKCKKGMTSYSETDYYPIDTICTFTCLKGYKIKDSNQMKCLKDGSWKGTLPECKTQYCSPLLIPKNGRIHPVSCSKKGAAVKQRCTFICKPGYEIEGQQIFTCKNNLTWNGEAPPICKPVEVQPSIQCPEDIYVTLSLGKAKHNVTVPNPTANTDMLGVSPSWIIVGENQEFSVGTTKITFIALSSTTNDTAECVTTVTVMDKEPPIFDYCPDPIKIEGASGEGEFVTWNEPIVKDNVELVSVFSIMKPNITLTPGTYFVEYIAKDSSGNTASCSFGINIIRMKCSRLADPSHGEVNCMDLKFGSMCIPQCDFGYMQDPDAPDFYSCDDSGIWEPSDVVSECLQFSPTNSSVCEDGFELKINKENGEEFCIECPSDTAWSSASRKCEEIMK